MNFKQNEKVLVLDRNLLFSTIGNIQVYKHTSSKKPVYYVTFENDFPLYSIENFHKILRLKDIKYNIFLTKSV